MKAVMLLSGGLDSLLAARVILEQGVELEALNFFTIFCNCTPKSRCCSSAASAVRQLGIQLKVINNTQDFLNVVRNPAHGYGSNLNPCIDCRILMFRKAGEYMHRTGASFIVTGEVLGERPMSQRRKAMKLIEKESGLQGLIVRPLSAANLEPSLPEQQGWIDRAKMLGIRGRSRKPQIALAASYGLKDYPCPAGGCLLTDPIFAARMRDLMQHQPDFSVSDVLLLKLGRHLRLTDSTKVIVGRDQSENERLKSLAREGDELFEAAEVPGPLTLLRGRIGSFERLAAAKITLTYGKARARVRAAVRVSSHQGSILQERVVAPLDAGEAETMRIGR
jgi:tRNA U34 2-thiouridine synthase MnmA/TrmU